MSSLFKRWWMLVAVLVTASVVVVSGTMPALASEPGEDSSWTNESVNNGQTLNSPDTYGGSPQPGHQCPGADIQRGGQPRLALSSRPEGVPTPP